MATKTIEIAAAKHALGDLLNDDRIESVDQGDWLDFDLIADPDSLSSSERAIVGLAEALYTGNDEKFSLMWTMATADEASWKRAIEAITMRRGIEDGLEILPGQFQG